MRGHNQHSFTSIHFIFGFLKESVGRGGGGGKRTLNFFPHSLAPHWLRPETGGVSCANGNLGSGDQKDVGDFEEIFLLLPGVFPAPRIQTA